MLHCFVRHQLFFKSESHIKHDSYFRSVVVVASDPCTPTRWIDVHKDTHFMIFFIDYTCVLDQVFSVETHFKGSVSLLEKFKTWIYTWIFDGIDNMG
jgi:hypothetical protein